MEQPQLTTYADIGEVRTVTGAATCNQLLADCWVLLGGLSCNNGWGNGTQGIRAAETAAGHPAVCAAFGGLCSGKETRIVN
jgi:hypothetical protein